MILLDTSVVSAVLRRRKKGDAEEALARRVGALLQSEKEIALPGIVLQELLSGIADRAHHARVLDAARASFPVALATEGDHLKAADLVNLTAGAGVALSTPDALIAAQALNRRASLFTTDEDFARLRALVGLRLI